MRILHTSDWHLGRSLYGRKRYVEFSEFLDWLGVTIEEKGIDILLVAGDIFDTSTPSNRSQELYYRFLCRVSGSRHCHIVVIAGNHDSPTFLNAPRELLRVSRIHVIGAMTENPEDEIIVLNDKGGCPQAIICAVPYLRDKDIRAVKPGETIDEKNANLIEGLKNHYKSVCEIAERKQADLRENGYSDVPIIAMGHLFTTGGKTVDGDGVRELYVGSLARVGKEIFPPSIDYLALGHLHVAQCVGDSERARYCGSPIPLGFGEAKREKKVVIIQFTGSSPTVEELPVPRFQALERVVGSLDEIHARLERLKRDDSDAWLEIEYTGADTISNLRETLDEALVDSSMEIRRIKNRQLIDQVVGSIEENETLDDLSVNDVFERCLEMFNVSDEERGELITSYNEIVQSLHEEDANAE